MYDSETLEVTLEMSFKIIKWLEEQIISCVFDA